MCYFETKTKSQLKTWSNENDTSTYSQRKKGSKKETKKQKTTRRNDPRCKSSRQIHIKT